MTGRKARGKHHSMEKKRRSNLNQFRQNDIEKAPRICSPQCQLFIYVFRNTNYRSFKNADVKGADFSLLGEKCRIGFKTKKKKERLFHAVS